METKRYIEQEDNKVFLIKEDTAIYDSRLNIKTIKEEMNENSINKYLDEDREQALRFEQQEKDTALKIKSLKKNIKEHSSERGYVSYKKNFSKYEMFEKIIELKFSTDIFSDEIKKDLKSYIVKREKHKNFYITMTMEKQLADLEDNLKAFDQIKEERKEFLEIVKKAKKLLR